MPDPSPISNAEDMQRRLEAIERRDPRRGLETSGGGGDSTGMEPWKPAIERLEDKLDSRFMWLLAAFGAGFILLATLIVNRTDAVSDRLGAKLDGLTQQVSLTNERVAKMEGGQAAASLPPSVPAPKR